MAPKITEAATEHNSYLLTYIYTYLSSHKDSQIRFSFFVIFFFFLLLGSSSWIPDFYRRIPKSIFLADPVSISLFFLRSKILGEILWMVEANPICDNSGVSLTIQRASIFVPLSSDSVFAFGSCKEGWYYRCLGIDPWKSPSRLTYIFLAIFFNYFWKMLYKLKKRGVVKGNRILISVTFLGSPGPIRFVANEGDLVAAVIDTALKCYAREGRLPILGSDFNDFIFYCPMVGPEGEINLIHLYIQLFLLWLMLSFFLNVCAALSPWEAIGSLGARNFVLCEKSEEKKKVEEENGRSSFPINGARKRRKRRFRAWINKSFSLKVTTH